MNNYNCSVEARITKDKINLQIQNDNSILCHLSQVGLRQYAKSQIYLILINYALQVTIPSAQNLYYMQLLHMQINVAYHRNKREKIAYALT